MSDIPLGNPDPVQVERLFNKGLEDEGREALTRPLISKSGRTVSSLDLVTKFYEESDNKDEVGFIRKNKGLMFLMMTLLAFSCAVGITYGVRRDDVDEDDNKLKPTQPPNSLQYCGTDANNINCNNPCAADVDCLVGSCYISPLVCTQYCADADGVDFDCDSKCAEDSDCSRGNTCVSGVACSVPSLTYCTSADGNSTLCDAPCDGDEDCFIGQSCVADSECLVDPPTFAPTITESPTNAPFAVQYCGTEDDLNCDAPCIFDDDCNFGQTCMVGLDCETAPPGSFSPTETSAPNGTTPSPTPANVSSVNSSFVIGVLTENETDFFFN